MIDKYEIAIFPGSFDPITNGHIDIVERSLKLFKTVNIAILDNERKAELFTAEERVSLIKKIFADYPKRIQVDVFNGLLVDYVNKSDSKVIVRGLRAISDFDYEAQMALMNRHLGGGDMETVFLTAKEENSYISSTLVKSIAPHGGDVSRIVHPIVEEALKKKFSVLGEN